MRLFHRSKRGNTIQEKLFFLQQRLSLSVLVYDSATLERILSNQAREANQDGEDEQDGHDGEGKDPLECDDVSQELGYTKGCELR